MIGPTPLFGYGGEIGLMIDKPQLYSQLTPCLFGHVECFQ
jgi:hypothetical protein